MGGSNLSRCETENIVALCDVDSQLAAKTFAKYPQARRYGNYREMFDKELAKHPWFSPAVREVFGGVFDPAKLVFPYTLVPGPIAVQQVTAHRSLPQGSYLPAARSLAYSAMFSQWSDMRSRRRSISTKIGPASGWHAPVW